MTVESYTGIINTQGEFQNVSTLTGVTFTEGKTYTIQIQNLAWVKISDAIFEVGNKPFTYKAGGEELQVKTPNANGIISVLENA